MTEGAADGAALGAALGGAVGTVDEAGALGAVDGATDGATDGTTVGSGVGDDVHAATATSTDSDRVMVANARFIETSGVIGQIGWPRCTAFDRPTFR